MSNASKRERILASVSDYLREPPGAWPTTTQAWESLLDTLHVGWSERVRSLYLTVKGGRTTDARAAVNGWVELAKREGVKVHPDRRD